MLLARYARGCRLLAELIVRAVAVVASSRVLLRKHCQRLCTRRHVIGPLKEAFQELLDKKNKATHEVQSNLKYPSSYEATEINKF